MFLHPFDPGSATWHCELALRICRPVVAWPNMTDLLQINVFLSAFYTQKINVPINERQGLCTLN